MTEPRLGTDKMSSLIWIQTVSHSEGIHVRMFLKSQL